MSRRYGVIVTAANESFMLNCLVSVLMKSLEQDVV